MSFYRTVSLVLKNTVLDEFLKAFPEGCCGRNNSSMEKKDNQTLIYWEYENHVAEYVHEWVSHNLSPEDFFYSEENEVGISICSGKLYNNNFDIVPYFTVRGVSAEECMNSVLCELTHLFGKEETLKAIHQLIVK